MIAKDLSAALDHIEGQQPGVVHAGRKGICVGYSQRGRTIIFRRVWSQEIGKEGSRQTQLAVGIRAEHWLPGACSKNDVIYLPLPPALAERAAKLMDR